MWYLIKFVFTACLLSACTAVYLLCATSEGLQYDIRWLSTKLPGELSVKKIDGALLTGFTLHDFSYKTSDKNISFKLLDVRWDPVILLKGKLDISRLNIEDGVIELSDSDESSENPNLQLKQLWQRIILRHIAIRNLSIKQATSIIEVNGDLTDHWDLSWKLHALDIKKWFPNYQGYLNSQGTISGKLTEPMLHTTFSANKLAFYDQTISQLNGQADISLSKAKADSSINLMLINAKLQHHVYKKISLSTTGHVIHQDRLFTVLIKVFLEKNHLISATIKLPNYSGITNPQQMIDAHVQLKPIEIKAIAGINTYLKNPHGNIAADIDIHGEMLNPTFSGNFSLQQGSFYIPSLKIQPDDIFIQGSLTENKIINLQGHLRSGTGNAKFNGNINLNEDGYPIKIALQGEGLSAVQLSEYKVLISPDIKIDLTYPVLKLQGKVLIPTAEIKPKNFNSTTTLPEEVVFVQKKKAEPASSFNMILDLDVSLGDKINIKYNELQTSLAGSIHITKDSDSPAVARGELHAKQGRYTTYGQKLAIEHGRLIYTGNTLSNPGIEIEATKKVRRIVTNNTDEFAKSTPLYGGTQTLKVGIRVHGTAYKPVITLFSNPSDISQADILSYIILGQPQADLSHSQGMAILSVLSTLNPNGGKITNFTDKLQETLGLSELNIESVQNFNPESNSVESTTSFVIGKQLTKKLSLHYSIGLRDPVSVLNLRYQINKHWAVQSETSTVDNGADLLYVIERD